MHKVIKFISNFLYNKTMKEVVKLLQLVFLGQLHWYFLQYCRVGLCRGQGKLGVGIWCCSARHGARKHCTLQWLLLLLTSCTSRQPNLPTSDPFQFHDFQDGAHQGRRAWLQQTNQFR